MAQVCSPQRVLVCLAVVHGPDLDRLVSAARRNAALRVEYGGCSDSTRVPYHRVHQHLWKVSA
jgi:hypothetical protein